jgi:uncharacterized protein YhjY with autotransporter beta-barrel domain
MKTYFWRICFAAFIIAIMAPAQSDAACQIVGYTINGYIVVCDGPDTIGVTSGNGSDIITIETGAEVIKTDLQSTDSTANANATTIDAGSGNNQVTNNGSIGATADANALPVDGSASQATANAAGINAGDGADVIQNSSTIAATATSNSESGNISFNLEGNTQFQGVTTSTATAAGIDGGSGKNQVINTGVIATMATSKSAASSINVDVGDSGGADVRTIANAIAAGISGGNGEDEIITKEGTITVNAAANVNNTNALITIDAAKESLVTGSSLSDASVTADAIATGIYGGEGDDKIVNDETEITVDADADATAVGVALTISGSLEGNIEGKALSDSSATANAKATGIDGGGGNDTIENRGKIFANADSTVTAAEVGVNIEVTKEGNASGEALSDTSVTANAAATGIDGGRDADVIDNRGDIELLANSDATGVSVSVDVAGTMKGNAAGSSVSDSSVTAEAAATGIDGGDGDDTIINDGLATTTNANATATGVSVGLTVSGSMQGNVAGKALSDASVTANAAATGIDGDSGQDTIENWSKLSSEVDASATGVAASLKVGFTKEGDVSPDALAEGSALSDASVTANAVATGIDGGESGDVIDNRGDIELLANSGATGVSVALDIAGTMKGSAAGSSVSDASVTAQSTATGIEGGEGDDTIDNEGTITLMKQAEGEDQTDAVATAVSVGLTVSGSMEGNAEGKALSDASALADASVIGIKGGGGKDTIKNRGAIVANVDSSATAVGLGLDVSLSLKEGGNANGAALSDASVTASAAATGIDGGEGSDAINNRGDMDLLANSDATGVAASLAIAGSATFNGKATGDVASEAVSDTSVTSAASVTGIDGGEGDDMITNQGDLNLFWAKSDATGVAASLNVPATGSFKGDLEGNAAGEALSDARVTAMAAAVAIDGNVGNDTIENKRDFGAIVAESGATGVAASLDIAGSVAFKGGVEGEVESKALSKSSTTAYAEATGIDGGEDKDIIVNEGNFNLLQAKSDATGVAASLNVAAGLAIQGDAKVDVSGAAVSDARVTAQATTTAIEGAGGDDEINNTGDLVILRADSGATGVAASLDIAGSLAFKGETEGDITGAALSDTSVMAEAFAMGLDAGEGHDTIINEGDIVSILAKSDATGVAAALSTTTGLSFKGDANVNASGEAVSKATVIANSMAIGIEAGEGDDTIINTGDIVKLEADSTATGVAAGLNFTSVLAIKGNAQADISGEAVTDSSVTAQAAALGIGGDKGNDEIDNEGDIHLLSTADATGVSASLDIAASLNFKGFSTADVSGTAASDTSVTAQAAATGIDGGEGRDTILNSGNITLMDQDVGVHEVDASALGVSASLNVSGNVAIKGVAAGTVKGAAASNATVTAEATATGIDGGGDNDIIDNTGAIKLLPSSDAVSIAVSLNVSGNMVGETEGSAMSDASVTAKSTATGIDGGEGADIIINKGAITLMKQEAGEDEVDAEALGVAASLDVSGNLNGTAEGQALSKATTTADAKATGISGAGGVDTITNTGDITADVDSDAEGVSIAAEVSVAFNGTAEGSSLSDASTTAKAKAAGIEAGEDDDIIDNSGVIQLSSDADATSTAVSLTVSGALRGQAGGEALSKATTTADATATGIDGGEGLDEITNLGLISADATATTDAVAVAGGLSFTLAGTADGAALSDLSSTSFAGAMGIDGGGDDDTIDNEGAINVSSLADAQATAVSVGLTGAMKGLTEGKSVADSSAEAIAQSIGIDGGDGNDRISSSESPITTFAQSLSDAESVSVQGTGAVGMAKGAAVADSSASSVSYSAGIDGGIGNDTIDNASEIKATAKADAEASSTTVGVTIGLGAAETIGTGNSSATAKANSTGIESGEGNDRITNTAEITTGGLENLGPMANAQAGATTVTVGIAAGLNMGEASSNAAAIAEVNTAGISSGSGDDWIYNTGDITVGPDPMGTGSMASASAKSTTVKVDVTLGASLGESSSDTSSTAVANLAGIRSSSGDDWVYNTGAITVGTDPYDPGKTDAMAKAKAASETVDVGITLGGSFRDASSNASATAQSTSTGIETDVGNDSIQNTSPIKVFSSSEAVGLAQTTKVSLTLGVSEGGAKSDASSLSRALATGIDSGGDADEISTDSELIVKARSKSTAVSTAKDYNILSVGETLQSAEANSSSTAEAIARGIDGSTGADNITAGGVLDITADTEIKSTSRSSTVTGLSGGVNVQESQSRAETIANSLAVGIDGGEGNDTIHSTAAITLNAFSNASTQATSATNTGFNIAGSSSGESVADAATNVTATGIGIRGGTSELAVDQSDADLIVNEGPISVTTTVSATTQSTSTAQSTTLIGTAKGKAVSNASAQVLAEGIGIDGGADNDTITNKNTLTVETKADSSVKSTSNVDSDVTFGGASSIGVSDASANVWAEATGMAGGSGDDVITSLASVTVEAESIGSVTAKSYVNADVTFGGASSKAASDASATKKGIAKGIDGGDGDDVIANDDMLNVKAISAGTVTSESRARADATFGSSSSMTTTAAALEGAADAAGIIGGSGDDRIKNLGDVNSAAQAELTVNSLSVATARSTFGSSDARASSVSTAQGKASSTGISGDDGKDLIENEGLVNASAIANTSIKSVTVAIARSTFGSEFTVAASTNYAAGESTSKGITAGEGDDEIVNKGLVTVEAGGTVKLDSLTVSSDGPAYSDAGTLALAYAKGVDGGAGNDGILNTDTVFVKAAPRISSATRTFGSGGNVDGKVGILLNGTATGITGGEGNDTITNEGNVLVFVGGPETESTVSENAVSGSTTITDKSFATSADPKELVGKWIRITGGENPDFFTQVVAFDSQTGTFTLRDPLKYDLPKDATYALYDYGQKTPDITSLNVTVGGRTRVDASTTASVQAKGIVGGDGDDHIVNAGTTAVSASNLVKTVTLSLTRSIVADTRIESTVNAVGIEGNDQSIVTDVSDGGTNVFTDLSRKGEDPEAVVGKPVLFKSGASTDFATLVESFDSDTGTFTLADPFPSGGLSRGDIYTLGGGSDSITNLGAIDVRADSAIDANSWSLSFREADLEGKGRAQAVSAGMRGGEFDDSFQNLGPIVTRSTADVSSTERVTVIFSRGDSGQKLSFEASSNSVGVEAGAGNDEFTNAENGSIDAEAVSTANVEGVTTTYQFPLVPSETKTINLADAIAQSTAVDIDLGTGRDVTSSEGEFRVSANAITSAKAISDFDLYGETDADADAIAKASAWGIRAGSGEDQVSNRNLIRVDASADATSFAQGAKVGSKDDTSTVTKDSSARSKEFVDASLQGQDTQYFFGKWVRFLTGENEDFFTRISGFDPSTGTITIFDELPGDLKAADLYTFSAARNGTSASVASALATGIDVGEGNAAVENTGGIRVKAFAEANTTASTYGGQATAQAESSSEARGIRTGSGDDVIRNAGFIDVESEVVSATSGASATEIANATGIDAGDGNNNIANGGQINVTASVDQPNGEAKARGIITGEGDDTIINEGTISATMIRNGISSLGVGINSGAGNDQIFLMNGSETNGHIDLSDGDDRLTLLGTPLVMGDVTGAVGIDTLVFDGAGSVGFTPMAFENAIKQGTGTYSVASLPTMQRIEIKGGVLEVNDNYQFSNNGSFETFVKGDGSFGQFKVNGTTELAGDLNVLKGPGPYIDGATYNIIEANAVNDAFSNVMLPSPNNFVSFEMNQFPTLVQIEVNVKDFTWVARNRVEWAVANYLDRILPSSTGDLSGILAQIQNLSQSEFSTALSTLSSDSYDNFTRNTFSTTHRYTKSLQYRLNNIRSFLHANGSANEPPILLAYRGSDWGQLLNPEGVSQIQAKNGLWFDAFGQWGDQSEESRYRWDGGYVGYDYFMRGATLGFDHALTDKLIAGVNAGYSRADIDLNHHQGSGYIKNLYGSLYGSYFNKNLYIDGALSYGRNWYDNNRLIKIGSLQRKAYSDHEGDLFSGYLGAGYTFDIQKWLIEPFASIQYIYLDEESFREKGADSLSLKIDDRKTDSFISELGLRLARVLNVKYGSLIPELSVAWLHDFDIDDRVITSSFSGSPGASFSIKGQDVERNGASLGAGITFVHKSGLSTSLKYRGEFREKYKSNSVMGELRLTF